MIIMNKVRDWNIFVKILLFLISLPCIWYFYAIIATIIAFIPMLISDGNAKIVDELYGSLQAYAMIVTLSSWIVFGFKLFKK